MRLRPMVMSDADFMLTLKNDEQTRKYAIVSHEEIKREDHIKFLGQHLKEFYMIEKWDGTSVGAIRTHSDEISIWVAKEFREFGIATKVLKGDINGYDMRWSDFFAKIVNGNVASFRAFSKAGYTVCSYQEEGYYILKKRS